MSYDAESPEATIAKLAESEAVSMIQLGGGTATPVASVARGMDSAGTMLLSRLTDALIVSVGSDAPQLLVIKAKTEPSWYRKHERWEHGIDQACIYDCEDAGQLLNLPVYIVIREANSPNDPKRNSLLSPTVNWLLISLSTVQRRGEPRAGWPYSHGDTSDRGRANRGGWLWPRLLMQPWRPAAPGKEGFSGVGATAAPALGPEAAAPALGLDAFLDRLRAV